MASSEASSTASSPTMTGHAGAHVLPPAYALPKPAARKSASRSPLMSSIPEYASLASPRDFNHQPTRPEETKLYDVHNEIKATLTDLLNCESVRKDSRMRMLVQTKLMDAELELKRHRRRRVATPSIVLTSSEDRTTAL